MTAQDPVFTPTYSKQRVDNIDLAQSLIEQMYANNRLRSRAENGGVALEISRWKLNSVSLDRVTFSSRNSITVDPLDRLYMVRMIGARLERELNGSIYRSQPGDVFLPAPMGMEYDAEYFGTDIEVVGLDSGLLDDLTGGSKQEWLSDLRPDALSPAVARAWQRVVDQVRSTLNTPELHTPLVLDEAQRLLAAAFLSVHDPGVNEPAATGRDNATAAVDRAIAFMETNPDAPLAVRDIARAARISVRSLQRAFRKHRQTTPMAYLRRVRLDRAHHDLCAADPGSTTVTTIAARWGFYDSGGFARLYRQAYGCTPSHTLRR